MTDANSNISPSNHERLLERLGEASSLTDNGRWDEAFALLLQEEGEFPEDPTLLCMLGVAASETGAEGAAYDFFRRCLAQQPEDPVLLATAGAGIAAGGDPDAERVLRLAAVTAPHLPITRARYGAYLAREGMLTAAIDELESARSLDAEDLSIRLELATAYLLSDRAEEGQAELSEVLARSPDDLWTRVLYGLALLEAGSTEEGAEQLHAASLERVDDWELHAAAAMAAAAEGWADEAWNAVARAELAPGVDPDLIHELEEYVEAGAEAAYEFLHGELVAPMLRARLLGTA